MFVLLVVGEAYSVDAEGLCLVKQQVGIVWRAGSPLLHGYFLVDADALEEDGLAVEQHFRALHLDIAEAYLFADAVGGGIQFHVVEFGILGTPAHEFLHGDGGNGPARGIGLQRERLFQFWNAQRDALACHGVGKPHRGVNQVRAVFVKLDEVVADVALGHHFQRHVAGDAAIVEPVERHGRYGILLAAVVRADGDVVAAVLQLACNVRFERRERSFVTDRLTSVHVDRGPIADATELQQVAFPVLYLNVEMATVPHCSLIVFQFLTLMVPVAWHTQRRGIVDGRLLAVVLSPRAVALRQRAGGIVLVDDGIPLSVERNRLAGRATLSFTAVIQRCTGQPAARSLIG